MAYYYGPGYDSCSDSSDSESDYGGYTYTGNHNHNLRFGGQQQAYAPAPGHFLFAARPPIFAGSPPSMYGISNPPVYVHAPHGGTGYPPRPPPAYGAPFYQQAFPPHQPGFPPLAPNPGHHYFAGVSNINDHGPPPRACCSGV